MDTLIRLSDENTWSCEPFLATDAESLRDGCLEAFAAFRAEWTGRGATDIHAYQTINRARHEALRPRSLHVQICYHGEWCAQPWTPVIREPGTVPNACQAWIDEDWHEAYARCLRTWRHVHALGKMLNWASRP